MKISVLLISAALLSGCYIRYPSIGKSGHTVRPTNWRGQVCVLTLNPDTGAKVYVCGPDRFRR
jgi:hypothetical protein